MSLTKQEILQQKDTEFWQSEMKDMEVFEQNYPESVCLNAMDEYANLKVSDMSELIKDMRACMKIVAEELMSHGLIKEEGNVYYMMNHLIDKSGDYINYKKSTTNCKR